MATKKKTTRRKKETFIYKKPESDGISEPSGKELDRIFKKWKKKIVFVSIDGKNRGVFCNLYGDTKATRIFFVSAQRKAVEVLDVPLVKCLLSTRTGFSLRL